MARNYQLQRTSTLALRHRRQALVHQRGLPAHLVRASLIEQFLTCGKANCACHQGKKHGPYYFLMICLGTGQIRKFRLKTSAQIAQARQSTAAYTQHRDALEELSQINAELLRRGEELSAAP